MRRGRVALEAFRTYRNDTVPAANRAEARQRLMDNMEYFGYGYLPSPERLVPPVGLTYWAFRVMVGGGMFLLAVLAVLLWAERRGRLEAWRWLLHLGLWSIAVVYVAGQQAGSWPKWAVSRRAIHGFVGLSKPPFRSLTPLPCRLRSSFSSPCHRSACG